MSFLEKLKGDGAPLPPQPAAKVIALAALGGFFAIAAVAALTDFFSVALVVGSFGATCVLVFAYPDVPFSQPRNVVVGHFLSSLIGLVFLTVFGPHWWSMALAIATAIAFMMLTRTVHPPAGSNPVIIFLTQPSWGFLLFPTLVGALVLVAVALIYNNATRDVWINPVIRWPSKTLAFSSSLPLLVIMAVGCKKYLFLHSVLRI